jgi:hypothetical protein
MTREQWLLALVVKLNDTFAGAGYPLPAHIRVSCGWPTQRALAPTGKSRSIGQCFSTACSADSAHEVFVSPALDDAEQVAAVLVHELCHAVDNCRHGHGPEFRRIAVALGLEGPMTATVPGEQLRERLNALLAEMPDYPHRTLDVRVDEKKQGTRLRKIMCPECGYTARTTRQWLDRGLPTCPCGTTMAERS